MRCLVFLLLLVPLWALEDARVVERKPRQQQQFPGYTYIRPNPNNPFSTATPPLHSSVPASLPGVTRPISTHSTGIAPGTGPQVVLPTPQHIPQPQHPHQQHEEGGDHHHHSSQIQGIEVACSKEKMQVRVMFDQPFSGTIYSKGHFHNPACRYVSPNMGRNSYEFTIAVDSCGSQFIDQQLHEGGQAYLENVIVFMYEPGIQEVWDTARRLRCLWQGNFEQAVNYAFNVDMLDLQTVTFSGDSVSAAMDVQLGRGPFAPSVTGLVKIGDTMTMVITVDGGNDFDILVRDCIAHDGDRSRAVVNLVDSRGCILKPKLMGAWQKTRQTGNTGASIIAYAYFQAFKFPDQMEVFLECNVELCKQSCDECPDPGQSLIPIDPRTGAVRRRRSILTRSNHTVPAEVSEPVRVGRRLRIVSPEDLARLDDGFATITLTESGRRNMDDVCMSMPSFITGLVVVAVMLLVSCLLTAMVCVRSRTATIQQPLPPHCEPCIYPSQQHHPPSFLYTTGSSKA